MEDWARDFPGERAPWPKTIKKAYADLKENKTTKYQWVPEIIVEKKVCIHLLFYLRWPSSHTPWVLTDQKLAEVKALCDTEDARPEHEKRASKGNENPLGLKQTTWQRHVT